MSINRGIGANRTSYNEKQEIQAFTIGVLKRNTEIRNSILEKNIGKYAMYEDTLNPAIGEYYDVYERENKRYTPIGDLFTYTNSTGSSFGKTINEKYKRPKEIEYYEVLNPKPETMAKWGGKYDDYVKYISSTYGHELKFNNFLVRLLGEYDIKHAMADDRVGVVRSINVPFSLAGVMMTNINNFSGKDTPLGQITNKMYASTLANAADFNSVRNTRYITPELVGAYGNNVTNLSRLSEMFPINHNTGRLAYLPGDRNYIGEEFQVEPSEQYFENMILNDVPKRFTPRNPYKKFTETSKAFYKTSFGANVYQVYSEGDAIGSGNLNVSHITNGSLYKSMDTIDADQSIYWAIKDAGGETVYNPNENSILKKTKDLFNNRKIGTIIGRFHTTADTDIDHDKASITQSAVSRYGMSHGRNLLKKGRYGQTKDSDNINGYDDPYCRVWTYHHQYSTLKDLIRPFNVDGENFQSLEDVQKKQVFSRHKSGAKHLGENSVLDSNGFVNITPTSDGIDIKKCMFSIENLAWKDVIKTPENISPEQIGPLNGRIMWFPPYNLKFSENSNVNWNSNDFIGRGERIYTYVNTERTGTLSFTLLVDHPSILNYWRHGKNSTQENEDDILRFFAGCGQLDLSDQLTEETEIITPEVTPPVTPQEVPPEGETIVFYVFFPNNYSGVDDVSSGNVDSATYLFCGRNAQTGGLNNPWEGLRSDSNPGYEMDGNMGITVGPGDDVIVGANGKWGYRIDSAYKNQRIEKGNYNDTKSFKLNSELGKQPMDATHTFAEVFTALNLTKDKSESGSSDGEGTDGANTGLVYKKAIACGADSDRIDHLYEIIETKKEKYVITNINISGSASSHGYNKLNNQLNKNRANTIKKWLSNSLGNNRLSKTEWGDNGNNVANTNSNSTADISAKLGRSVRVEIILEGAKVDDLSNTNPQATSPDNQVTANTINEVTEAGAKEIANENPEPIVVKRIVSKGVFEKDGRYDGEGEFFRRLTIEDPLARQKIIEKVKYFDPAFHSISPEGFNSRLTFLHQCTRQGHTIDSSDQNGYRPETAGNMAFGRAPICVLRLGDFFYTRVVIDSVSIDYDPMLWDMNPEGIGLQPMMANVSLSFKFIGGADLGGPITRLQNAVTFNYYANTSVYDDRADRITYKRDEGGEDVEMTYNNIWLPQNKK